MKEEITNEQLTWSAENVAVEEFEAKAQILLDQMRSFNSEAQALYDLLKQKSLEHSKKFSKEGGDAKKDIKDAADLVGLRSKVDDKILDMRKFKFHLDL